MEETANQEAETTKAEIVETDKDQIITPNGEKYFSLIKSMAMLQCEKTRLYELVTKFEIDKKHYKKRVFFSENGLIDCANSISKSENRSYSSETETNAPNSLRDTALAVQTLQYNLDSVKKNFNDLQDKYDKLHETNTKYYGKAQSRLTAIFFLVLMAGGVVFAVFRYYSFVETSLRTNIAEANERNGRSEQLISQLKDDISKKDITLTNKAGEIEKLTLDIASLKNTIVSNEAEKLKKEIKETQVEKKPEPETQQVIIPDKNVYTVTPEGEMKANQGLEKW